MNTGLKICPRCGKMTFTGQYCFNCQYRPDSDKASQNNTTGTTKQEPANNTQINFDNLRKVGRNSKKTIVKTPSEEELQEFENNEAGFDEENDSEDTASQYVLSSKNQEKPVRRAPAGGGINPSALRSAMLNAQKKQAEKIRESNDNEDDQHNDFHDNSARRQDLNNYDESNYEDNQEENGTDESLETSDRDLYKEEPYDDEENNQDSYSNNNENQNSYDDDDSEEYDNQSDNETYEDEDDLNNEASDYDEDNIDVNEYAVNENQGHAGNATQKKKKQIAHKPSRRSLIDIEDEEEADSDGSASGSYDDDYDDHDYRHSKIVSQRSASSHSNVKSVNRGTASGRNTSWDNQPSNIQRHRQEYDRRYIKEDDEGVDEAALFEEDDSDEYAEQSVTKKAAKKSGKSSVNSKNTSSARQSKDKEPVRNTKQKSSAHTDDYDESEIFDEMEAEEQDDTISSQKSKIGIKKKVSANEPVDSIKHKKRKVGEEEAYNLDSADVDDKDTTAYNPNYDHYYDDVKGAKLSYRDSITASDILKIVGVAAAALLFVVAMSLFA